MEKCAVKEQYLKLAYNSFNNTKGLNISYKSKILYIASRPCFYKECTLIFDINVARLIMKLSIPNEVFEIIEIFSSTKFKHFQIYYSMMHKFANESMGEAESYEMFLFDQKVFS
ncbi:8-oxoguanine DNA glycosylase OGG fold protein [Sphingobacterium cellulitidis]|uniref:8-oxoguanine DNA glycosylase OGG fold protein n=1 Tax=Sphingobacterium cellulitidis TaxID=1768011 RepID=UPI000B94429F|nr:hypothetical protein CHT99_03500 [Sphingobacterium cellulitidis]